MVFLADDFEVSWHFLLLLHFFLVFDLALLYSFLRRPVRFCLLLFLLKCCGNGLPIFANQCNHLRGSVRGDILLLEQVKNFSLNIWRLDKIKILALLSLSADFVQLYEELLSVRSHLWTGSSFNNFFDNFPIFPMLDNAWIIQKVPVRNL